MNSISLKTNTEIQYSYSVDKKPNTFLNYSDSVIRNEYQWQNIRIRIWFLITPIWFNPRKTYNRVTSWKIQVTSKEPADSKCSKLPPWLKQRWAILWQRRNLVRLSITLPTLGLAQVPLTGDIFEKWKFGYVYFNFEVPWDEWTYWWVFLPMLQLHDIWYTK